MNRTTHTNPSKDEWLKLRAHDITSTEVSALFGISPYLTAFELWHQKRDASVVSIEENERMKWGSRLQNSIADGIAQDNGWKIRQMSEYIRLPQHRIGASFDFEVLSPEAGLLEVKNVDALAFRDGWLVDGDTIEAPPHIEMQIQHQMLVSGHRVAHIGALIGGNRVTLIRREFDVAIGKAILSKVSAFWTSVIEGQEPKPDFQRDAEMVIKLNQYATPGRLADVSEDVQTAMLVAEYSELGKQAKSLDERRRAIKAELLTKIGDAEKAIGSTFTISAGLVGPAEVSYKREGYRDFRVFMKRSKS